MLDSTLVDQVITVGDDEAMEMARRLACEEGIPCGISAGANVLGALAYARDAGRRRAKNGGGGPIVMLARCVIACSLLSLAVPAAAAELCFDDDGGADYIFMKIKLPKRPLEALPVAGTRVGTTGVSGTVFRSPSGGLRFSLTTGSGCFVSVVLDDALEGSAFYDCLSGLTDTTAWTPIDCDAVQFP